MPVRDGAWRQRRLADAVLYLCVGCRREQGDLPALLDATLSAGVDLVQLRDKDATADELRAAAPAFRDAARHHGALFVLNDFPELAVEVGADGVHVGQEDVAPSEARAAVGDERLVGRSTHSTAEIDRALAEDCDYFAVGPVHPTPTKPGRPGVGLEPVRHAARVAGARPWFVTGWTGGAGAPEVLAAGARRLVVVRALTEASDPGRVARELAALLR